jgi:hypothetical protein
MQAWGDAEGKQEERCSAEAEAAHFLMNVGRQAGLPSLPARFDEARPIMPKRPVSVNHGRAGATTKSYRSRSTDGTIATQGRAHRESWCFPKKHGLHFAALDGPIFIEENGPFD